MTPLMEATRSDEALVPALARGDEEALGVLLDRYWPRAYALAHRLVGEPHAAEDVAQEAFVRLLRGAGRFDPGRPFRPWFFQLVTNEARKHHRARSRRVDREARAARPEATRDPDAARAEAVQSCLATLPAAQREPIALHYLAGLTFQEVADALACPLGTVTSRVRRGLEDLRGRLAPTHALGSTALVEVLRRPVAAPGPAPTAAEVVGAARGPAPGHVAPTPDPARLMAAAQGGAARRLALGLVALGAVLLVAAAALPLGPEPPGGGAPAVARGDGDAESPAAEAGAPAPDPQPVADPAPDGDDADGDDGDDGDEAGEGDEPAPDGAPVPAEPPAVELPAGRGGAVVRVVDADGPVRDVELDGFAIVPTPTGATAGRLRLRTDADGWLTLPPLPPGAVSLDLRQGDRRADRLVLEVGVGEVARTEVALEPGAVVTAEVVADGAGPGRATARLSRLGAPAAAPIPPVRLEEGAGALRVGGLAPGRYALRVEREGFAALERTVALEAAESLDLGRLRLGGAGVLVGRLVAGSGPVAGAVLVFGRDGASLGRVRTDAAGRFRFAGVAPGPVAVRLPGGATHDVVVAAAGELALGDLLAPAATDAALSGRVFGPDGRARAGVALTLASAAGAQPLDATTDASGRYAFVDVEPGRYALRVAWGELTAPPARVALRAGDEAARDVTLAPGGAVSGTVRAAPGRLARLRVTVVPAPVAGLLPPRPRTVALDGRGRYRLDGLPAGTYRVSIPGGSAEVEVAPGEAAQADFDLTAGVGAVEVRLQGASAPASFVAVAARPGEEVLAMIPGARGRARLEDVPVGPVDVAVVVPGSLPQRLLFARGVEVRAGEAVEVALAWPDPAETGAVAGRVVGRRPADAPDGLTITARGAPCELTDHLRPDGGFDLAGLPPGAYALEVRAMSAPAPFARGEVTVAAGATAEVELTWSE